MANIFIVVGKIQPKQRPRFARRGGRVYTPKETVQSEACVAKTFRSCFPGRGITTNPITMEIFIFIAPPKHIQASKKKMELVVTGKLRPVSKPDLDNSAKTICDALNKVMYNDDSQIVKLVVEKFYSAKNQDYTRIKWEVLPQF